MAEPTECPTCGVDITTMDAIAFRDHTKEMHPELYDLISRALRSFGSGTAGDRDE